MRVTGFTKPSSGPFLLGVAGGSGSGKTYFALALQKALGREKCAIISQDSFYFDQSHRFDFDGGSVNFDHPESLDFESLAVALRQIKAGKGTDIPVYDFVTHRRQQSRTRLEPTAIVVVDGILIFHSESIRREFDDMIFFDTSETLRYQRRLERDVRERGRTPEGVRAQFVNQVKPMHDEFVEASKKHARVVLTEGMDFLPVLNEICKKIKIA